MVNHSAFIGGGAEREALTCKSLLLLYLPPLISFIATWIWVVIRRTHRLTALSSLSEFG